MKEKCADDRPDKTSMKRWGESVNLCCMARLAAPMCVEVQITIMLRSGVAIRPEAVALLDAIVDTGSITAAARANGISYKKAWHMIDRLNLAFRRPVVTAARGGDKRGGAQLTQTGSELVALYRTILGAARSPERELVRLDELIAP